LLLVDRLEKNTPSLLHQHPIGVHRVGTQARGYGVALPTLPVQFQQTIRGGKPQPPFSVFGDSMDGLVEFAQPRRRLPMQRGVTGDSFGTADPKGAAVFHEYVEDVAGQDARARNTSLVPVHDTVQLGAI